MMKENVSTPQAYNTDQSSNVENITWIVDAPVGNFCARMFLHYEIPGDANLSTKSVCASPKVRESRLSILSDLLIRYEKTKETDIGGVTKKNLTFDLAFVVGNLRSANGSSSPLNVQLSLGSGMVTVSDITQKKQTVERLYFVRGVLVIATQDDRKSLYHHTDITPSPGHSRLAASGNEYAIGGKRRRITLSYYYPDDHCEGVNCFANFILTTGNVNNSSELS